MRHYSTFASLALSALTVFLFSACAVSCHAQATPPPSSTSASVAIVIDSSSSTKWDMGSLEKGALELARKFNFNDELAIFAAGDKPKLVQDFTGDTDAVVNAVKHVPSKGKLNLYDAVIQAVQHVRSDGVNERQAVVAFANKLDGADTRPANKLEELIRQKQAVPVYFVVMHHGDWQSQELAQRIAVLSGGAAYFPSKGSEVTAISDGLASRLGAGLDKSQRAGSPHGNSIVPYKTVVVRSIPVAQNGQTSKFPNGDNILLQRLLVSRLQKANVFSDVVDAGNTSGLSDHPAGGRSAVELLAMVNRYQTARRPFGSAKLEVQVVLEDSQTRNALVAFKKEASGPSQLLGGENSDAVQTQLLIGVANQIVDEVAKLKRERER
jgi:hypothetical protein